MTKHTVLSNASHIIYDGLSSRMFGITNVQPADGLAKEAFLPNTSLVTDKSRYNDRVYLLGVNREPLEFSMRLLFDPHTFDERKLQEMKRWFYQDTYKPFRFDSGQEQDLDIWVYAIAVGDSSATHNAINDGFIDFSFKTNAPYRFSQVMEDEFDFSVTNTEKMLKEIKDGFYSATDSMETLVSRLKQSVTGTGSLNNQFVVSYQELITPLADKVTEQIKLINTPYSQLAKVNGASSSYRSRWQTKRKEIEKIVKAVDISKDLDVSQQWLKANTNLYSKTLSTKNLKLELDGAEVYDEAYVASEFIPVETGVAYNWHTHEPVPHIDSPRIIMYNKDKDYHEGVLYDSSKKIDFVPPEGIEFIRICAPIDKVSNSVWKLEEGSSPTFYTEHPFDAFPVLEAGQLLTHIQELQSIMLYLDTLEVDTSSYIQAFSSRIDNTLDLYPDIVNLYNFGDLPVKPVMEIEIVDPADIRIENIDTGESTTLTNNIKGEVITLLNETEQVRTSRSAPYFKYDDHDDNFITLRKYENTLQFFGSFKVKITYQFKIL